MVVCCTIFVPVFLLVMLVHQFNIEANPNMAKSTREIIFQTHCFGSMLDLGGASLLSRPPAAFIFEIVSNMAQAQTPPSTQWTCPASHLKNGRSPNVRGFINVQKCATFGNFPTANTSHKCIY